MAQSMSPTGENKLPAATGCAHCGFEMTPLRLGRDLQIAALDGVFECRSCGVMQMPEVVPAAGQTPSAR